MLHHRDLLNNKSMMGWALAALMLIGTMPLLAQTTIHVPAEQATIQAAIDVAATGDTVLVAPGTYYENIDFKGKAITVTSVGGREVTTIDGGGNGSVVTFATGESAASMISGFTITNGSAYSGGGMYVANAAPRILQNTIAHNTGCAPGIYVDLGAATIQGNSIVDNVADCYGGRGAGIAVAEATTGLQILDNVIANNTHPDGSGGGIALWYPGAVIVRGNVISGNTTYYEGAGIEIRYGAEVQIINNLIVGNTATGFPDGGGVYVYGHNNYSGPLLLGNTIAGNDASSGLYSAGPGGGMRLFNNLIIGKPGQAALYCEGPSSNAPIMQYNDIYSESATALGGDCGLPIGSNGNISQNPLFVGIDVGNYHLQPTSLAIDAGDNSFTGIPTLDLAGGQRIYDGNNDGTETIDQGSFEYAGLTSLGVSTETVSFATQKVGTSSDAVQVTITNTGDRTLDVSAITVTDDFAQTNTCRTSKGIAEGQSCTIDFTFTPSGYGNHQGTATIYSNVGGTPQTISLSGTASQPKPVLQKTTLTFGDQMMNTTSAPQVVTLGNNGDTDLVVSGLTVTTNEFGATSTCTVVAPGDSCSISVTFTPAGTRNRTADIYIYDDAIDSPQKIELSGTGLGPEITFSATALDLGRRPVGSQSDPVTLTVTNSGSAVLEVSSVQITGDYAETNNCRGQLAPGNSCQAQITFTPTAVGTRAGAISFYDSAAESPQTVTLSGSGADPAIASLSETAVTFPGTTLVGQSSLPYSITYKNVGEQTLLISGMTTSTEFSQTNDCGTSLEPGISCSIAIVFMPTAVGTTMGSLQITDNAAGSPRSVTLAGTGMAYAVPTLTTVSPQTVKMGAAATLNVTGTNFYPASVIYWGEQALSTTFVNSTSLTASLPGALTSSYGDYSVTVRTPAPGGGATAAQTVSVVDLRPTADSVSPIGGTGNATFTFKFSDPSGYSNLNFVQGIINGSAAYPSGCAFMYLVGNNRVYLMNDAGSAWVGSAVAGTSTTLSNSQCTIDVSGVSGSGSGNQLTLNVPVSFASPFEGQKSVYAYAASASANSGWQKLGTWTPNVPVVVPVETPPVVESGSYDRMMHLMNFTFSSVNGASYIDWVQGMINTNPTYASGCAFSYIHSTNRLYLMNDAGTAWLAPVTLGTATTISNSQCTIDAVKSWSQDAGNRLLLVLSISASTSVVGTQNIYGYAVDHGGLNSGWVWTGTWLPNPPLANTPPRVVSATSTPGIMSFTFASDNGGGYLSWVQTIVGPTYSYANGCTVYYQRAAKRFYLSNDAGTAWLGPVYLGQNTSVANSQCTVYGGNSSETITGNNLTLNVAATYAPGFLGVRNAWGYAVDNVGKKSNWVNLGPFTVQ